MKRIDKRKTDAILKSYRKGLCKTVPLEDLCEAFELSIKEDGDVLFEILGERLWYSDKPQQNPNKFAWHVDEIGFYVLSDYAHAKQECLSTFQDLYLKGYINQSGRKKEEE